MITLFLQGQKLTLAQPVVAADSVAYITARPIYKTADWMADGLSVWAHFRLGDTQIDAEAVDGEIGADAGVNLTAGVWTVWVTGHVYDGTELIQRITTETAKLTVKESGATDGEPLPTGSFGEAILGEVRDIYRAVGDTLNDEEAKIDEQLADQNAAVAERLADNEGAVSERLTANEQSVSRQLTTQNETVSERLAEQNTAMQNQLAAQNNAVDNRLEENEAIIDAAFGGLKNWRDGKWLKLWAGTEEQYAAADKYADTVYLIDLGLEGGPAPAGGDTP